MALPFTRGDVAIDLGTAATRLHARPHARPVTRPSVVWRAGGPRPALRQGVVVDPEAAADVVGDLLRKVGAGSWRRPRAMACVPTDASADERAAVVEAVRRAGAASVAIVSEPLAAAHGAGLEVAAPRAQALVDLGEGVTDCAVLRDGALVASETLRVAVGDLRETLRDWIAESAGVRLCAVEAERVLREAGVGSGGRPPRRLHLVGSPERGTGPVRAWIEEAALHAALEPVLDAILARVGAFLAGLPEPLRNEVAASGVCLTGGGALLGGMVERLVAELRTAVWRAPAPLLSVVDGARILSLTAPRSAFAR